MERAGGLLDVINGADGIQPKPLGKETVPGYLSEIDGLVSREPFCRKCLVGRTQISD